MTKTDSVMTEEEKTNQSTGEGPLNLNRNYYTPKMIGQLESDKLKAPPLHADDRNRNTSVSTDMRDVGKKVLLSPMGPAKQMSDLDKSPWVGKAVGMNMLIGLAGIVLAKFLGCNLFQSIGWGLGAFTMGQEIRSMFNTTTEVLTGKRGLNDGRAVASIVPMILGLAVAVLKHNPNWTMGALLTSTLASRGLNNYWLKSDTYYRYYQHDREQINPALIERREQIEKAEREQTITIREDLDEMLSEREMEEHVRQHAPEKEEPSILVDDRSKGQQAGRSQSEENTNSQGVAVAKGMHK